MKSLGTVFAAAGVVWLAAVALFKFGSQRSWQQAWDDLLPAVLSLLGS